MILAWPTRSRTGIESLQKMAQVSVPCANALGIWSELEGSGAGFDKELRANVLPGVTIVPG
jgi:hypothetical protein